MEKKHKDKKWRSPLQDVNVVTKCNSNSSNVSSSRTHLHKNPKVPKSTRLRSKSTNENDLPKPKKNPPFLPTSQKSNMSSHPVKKSASGSERMRVDGGSGSGELLDLDGNLTSFDNCTPLGKLASTCNNGTPPIEASVSPEIQCSGLVSAATTPCYAAGHVLSGVTDKRKCRPRGVLTLVDSSESYNKSTSRASLIPLPALASMHWLNDISEGESLNEFRMLTRSSTSEFPYSTSTCSGSSADSLRNRAKYSDSVNRDAARSPESPQLKDPSFDEMGRNMFLSSPLAISCCHDVKVVADEWKYSSSLVSPCSTASLSSGNVIQTPKSDSCAGFSWLHSGDRGAELDSVPDFLYRTSLSPTTQLSGSDPSNLHFKFTSASWVSDSTLDNNVSQSQMRISWRDGIVSRIFEIDDLDCCRCLSDEENNGGYCYTNAKTNVGGEENDLLPESGSQSPEFLEHKHELPRNGTLKSALPEANSCAESIQTEGGGLVSSADSDWTLSYKNSLYQI